MQIVTESLPAQTRYVEKASTSFIADPSDRRLGFSGINSSAGTGATPWYVGEWGLLPSDSTTSVEPQNTTTLRHVHEALITHDIGELVEDDDDYGLGAPTDYAKRTFVSVLSQALSELLTTQPPPVYSISPDGGLRADWFYAEMSLRLVVPGSRSSPPIIFWENRDQYGTVPASARNLVHWLTWLSSLL